ncbi:Cysteine-rich secretory protein family protein [Lutimaribacter pacificus]|uniref:Cysteine-rich secretory protein family protein n=1 Tax=Lutimaribacter pacificus TaxID=391948 RepID=A0A1H0GYK3_9RHOB|nr:CAP domain-containing protein [Lutimaribacter pacificus]SDO12126.1 Cysteine-rich secretory protein family protein [Lutimaribacter pacificus]SHJ93712.1 Cysteine-rich secretory protein family protein [Lutimaribacter pacificus]
MILLRRLAPVLLAAMAAGVARADCALPPDAQAQAAQVVALVNGERQRHGLPALAQSGALAGAAGDHSCFMAATGRMSHTGRGGRKLGARLRDAGYGYRAAAENVAHGYRDAGGVVAGWMQSDGHRRNILMRDVTQAGAAMRAGGDGRPYWTLILGRPR